MVGGSLLCILLLLYDYLPACVCTAKVSVQADGLMEARRAWVGQEMH